MGYLLPPRPSRARTYLRQPGGGVDDLVEAGWRLSRSPSALDGRSLACHRRPTSMLVLSFADLWMDAPAERGEGEGPQTGEGDVCLLLCGDCGHVLLLCGGCGHVLLLCGGCGHVLLLCGDCGHVVLLLCGGCGHVLLLCAESRARRHAPHRKPPSIPAKMATARSKPILAPLSGTGKPRAPGSTGLACRFHKGGWVGSKTHDGHAAQGPAVATQTDASHVRACRYGADEATIRDVKIERGKLGARRAK